MRNSHLAAYAIDHERLRVLDRAGAGRRVTRVPDRACALQSCQFLLAKDLRHQTHVLVHEKAGPRAVACDNPGALLSAVLQRKQTIIRQHCCVRVAEDAEKSALVLRQNGRVGHLVWVWFVRGASHMKQSIKLAWIQSRLLQIHKLGMLSSCSTARRMAFHQSS